MSGAVYMGGEPGRPSRAAVSWVDFATALHAAFGTLVALMSRARTGTGQVVEAALLPTAVALNGVTLLEQAVLQRDRRPTGNRGQLSMPSDVFRTRDGWVLCQVFGNPMFGRWAALMGEERWRTDPRFRDDISRGDNGAAICERMTAWCADRTTAEALDSLERAGIPGAVVLTPQEVLDHPQVQATGVLQPVDYPGLPYPAPVARIPVWLSETAPEPRRRAPLLGEHNEEIYTEELGLTAAQLAIYAEAGAI